MGDLCAAFDAQVVEALTVIAERGGRTAKNEIKAIKRMRGA
jgi:hypothetical protein